MTRITLIPAAALTALALAAPTATAVPIHDAGTTRAAPQQDLRGADARDASIALQRRTPASDASARARTGPATPGQDLRSPDARDAATKPTVPVRGLPTQPVDPAPMAPASAPTTPVAGDSSPLLYILPGIALSLLLAAGLGYAIRTFSRARISA